MIVFARDMDAMAAFYRDVVGLAPLGDHSSADWRAFDSGGECELALHGISEPWRAGVEIADPPEARVSAPIKIALRVDDVAAWRAELTAKGVRFAREPGPEDTIVRFDILDPEGNIVQISRD